MITSSLIGRGLAGAFAVAMVIGLAAAPARAAGCSTPDAFDAKIRAARTCERAHAIYSACQLGSSADEIPASIVVKTCEAAFRGRDNSGQEAAYRHKLATCRRHYDRNGGTLALSQLATCRADAAYSLAHKLNRKG